MVDCLSIIRKLSEKRIGVLFESEAIYSLNDDSHMALSFQATIAEQESRTRSRVWKLPCGCGWITVCL